jgi:four helix bundle protein
VKLSREELARTRRFHDNDFAQPLNVLADRPGMFNFRKLDVYQCTLAALPLAYELAKRGDTDMKRQLRRAALSILLNIAEATGRRDHDQRQFYRIARGSALECASVLDAMIALKLASPEEIDSLEQLLVRVVSMLSKLGDPATAARR